MRLFSQGDERAFKSIFDYHYQQLVYFAVTLVTDEAAAQDAAADAFVQLWRNRSRFKSLTHIKNYLFLNVRHSCLDLIKSKATHQKVNAQIQYISEKAEESIERAMAESEVIRDIAEQVASLPGQCRRVFSHIFFDGMTTEQVAAEMNISTKNVLNQKGIAIKQLRALLLKNGLLTAFFYLVKSFG